MTPLQKAFAITTAVLTFCGILELVRRRKLKEEYAWLWLLTSGGMIVLVTWYGLLEWLSHITGAVAVTTTVFIFALLFLLLITVHFSMVISRLTHQVRRIAQELAILQAELADRELRASGRDDPARAVAGSQGPQP